MDGILGYVMEKKGSSLENEIFREDATTVRTLKNIRNTLTKTLLNKGIIDGTNSGDYIKMQLRQLALQRCSWILWISNRSESQFFLWPIQHEREGGSTINPSLCRHNMGHCTAYP